MYQRMFMFRRSGSILKPRVSMAAEAERQRHGLAQDLVDHDEEQACEHDQEQYEPGGDEGLAPRRPDDLGSLGANLLNEFERVGHCFVDVGFWGLPAQRA